MNFIFCNLVFVRNFSEVWGIRKYGERASEVMFIVVNWIINGRDSLVLGSGELGTVPWLARQTTSSLSPPLLPTTQLARATSLFARHLGGLPLIYYSVS